MASRMSTAALPDSLQRALDNASADDLKSFLSRELASDDRMAARFVALYGGLGVKELKKALKSELSSIKRSYASGGFIDWRASLGFESEYCAAISSYVDPAVAKHDADAIFELLEAVLTSFRTVHIDDSNGFVTDTFNMLKGYWGKAFLYTPDKQVPKRIAYMHKLVGKVESSAREGDFDWLITDGLYEFPIDLYADDPAFAPLVLDLIDKHMAELREKARQERAKEEQRRAAYPTWGKASEYTTHSEYELTRWVEKRLVAMEAVGAPLDDLREVASAHRKNTEIVTKYADLCAERGEPAFAIGELEAALVDDLVSRTAVSVYLVRLLKIYEDCGMQDKAKAAMKALLQAEPTPVFSSMVSIPALFRRYKACFLPEQWEEERERLFSGIRGKYVFCDCLVAEGLYERLYEYAASCDRFRVEEYEDVLVQVNPEFVFRWYEKSIMGEFELAYDRKGYRRETKALTHVAKLPGGAEAASRIAAALQDKYPRKKALLEELAKAGF